MSDKKIFSDKFYSGDDKLKDDYERYLKSNDENQKEFIEFYAFVKNNMHIIQKRVEDRSNCDKYEAAMDYLRNKTNYRIGRHEAEFSIINLFAKHGILKAELYTALSFIANFILLNIILFIVELCIGTTYSIVSLLVVTIVSVLVTTFIDIYGAINFYSSKK